jgi:hypothetical protein
LQKLVVLLSEEPQERDPFQTKHSERDGLAGRSWQTSQKRLVFRYLFFYTSSDMRFSEGIPWRDYSVPDILLAIPLAVLIYGYTRLMRLLGSEKVVFPEDLPRNALVFAFHTDTFASAMADDFRDGLKATWIGYHGSLSYMGSLGFLVRGEPCFRYQRRNPATKPMQQILDFLKRHQGRVYIRTDAGGPYKQVKPSLVDLALSSDRPLVAVRHRLSRDFILHHHALPLAGAQLETWISRPLYPEELKKAPSREAALFLVQNLIDQLPAS